MAVVAALFSASLLTNPMQSQEPKSTVREVVTAVGTVDGIDVLSRGLTLRTSAGAVYTIHVAPELTLFDELKRGDIVTVRLYESVIVAVRPGVRPSVAVDTTKSANQRESSGQTDVLQQLKAAVTVERIDLQQNAVQYMTADNRRVIRAVADPRLLEGLKPGDVIEITHSRERAIELQRASKGG
jgi:Cu/Ag efflux protein CusF